MIDVHYKMRYSSTSCFFYENALTVAHLPTKHQCTDARSSQIFSPQWSKYSYLNLIIQYSLLCSIVIDDSPFMFINDVKRYFPLCMNNAIYCSGSFSIPNDDIWRLLRPQIAAAANLLVDVSSSHFRNVDG